MVKKDTTTQAVFVLHGWALDEQNQSKWDDFFHHLRQWGVNDITWVPVPGLDLPLEEVWGVPEYAQYLATVLPPQPIVLLGHSFGGQLALKYAQLFPERVTSLILIDSAGMKNVSLLYRSKKKIFGTAAMLGKQLTQSPKARALLYKLARASDYQAAPASLRQTMSQVVEYDSRTDAASVTAPTLIIWGEHDSATPLSMGYELHHLIPVSQLKVIPAARHSPQFTHPEATAQLAASFITQHSLGTEV